MTSQSKPATGILAPVPKVHLDSVADSGMTTVLFGTRQVDLFMERGVMEDAIVYLYESMDDDHPVGESAVTWVGRFSRWIAHENLTHGDDKKRPITTEHTDTPWPIYWEVSGLRRLEAGESFTVSDLLTDDGKPISPAFVPHGPLAIRG